MKAMYKSVKRAVGIKSRKPPKDGDDDVAAVASEEARGRSMTVAAHGAAAGLWSSPDEDAKQAFQRDKWLPFFREVDGAVKATRKRYEEGVGFEAVLPPQADWAAWTTRCRALTLEWHGSPNVSMLYEALIECSEHDGEAPYRFEQVPRRARDRRGLPRRQVRLRGPARRRADLRRRTLPARRPQVRLRGQEGVEEVPRLGPLF